VLLTINTVTEQWTEILITVDDQLVEYNIFECGLQLQDIYILHCLARVTRLRDTITV